MKASVRSLYLTRPDVLLRLEGLVALMIECTAYQHFYPGHWGLFALLFLVPDLSLLTFALPGGKGSAAIYNVAHWYALPLALGLFAWAQCLRQQSSWPTGAFALIWLAHISFDRSLGFGLKFPGNFGYTHIQCAASIEGKT